MKITSLIAGLTGVAALVSCSPTTGVSMQEYSALLAPTKAPRSLHTIKLSLKEPGRRVRTLPSVTMKDGDPGMVKVQRDFVYPTSYQPATVSGSSARPVTPGTFKTEPTGFEANLTARTHGSLVLVQGEIIFREFLGFTKMTGELSKPIIGNNNEVIAENSIQMPKFATYTTPISITLQPGGSAEFEVSHPSEGCQIIMGVE